VFRDASVEQVSEAVRRLNLHAVQLHGSEDQAYRQQLRDELPAGTEIWQAVDAQDSTEDHADADRLLFDNGAGGTGESFEWSLIQDHPALSNGLIAGGLGVGNVRAAANLGCHAIDVGSSVDEAPGLKSAEKIAALFDALRTPTRQEKK
jgi:indole-3-glycerol phosphate synthase/phosphoribosylanthranilate isomerase